MAAGNLLFAGKREHLPQRAIELLAAGGLYDEMIAVITLQPHDWGNRGPEHAHSLVARRLKPAAELAGPTKRLVELLAAHQHVGQRAEGWVVHPSPESHLLIVKTLVIVALCELDGVVLRMKCLQNDPAGHLPTASASRDLGQQLKGALGGAKIGKPQGIVGAHHAYQSDAVHVVSFGDHLRSH